MAKKSGILIEFLGQSAFDVTGSCYQIKFGNHTILLDCGLYQNNIIDEDYKINHERPKSLKPKDIDYIFISHANIDHFGKLPWLYKLGCTAKICVPRGNIELMKIMLKDSAKIMVSDSEKLTSKYGINAHPLYLEEDIDKCLNHMCEYDFDIEYEIDNDIKVKFLSAHHIINSAQIQLTLKDGLVTKRIGYTGDIGSPSLPKKYVQPLEPLGFCDLIIGEATYSGTKRNHSIKDRDKDIEKINSIIWQTCKYNKSKLLLPVFSLDRLETILTILFELYGNDEHFDTKVIVDTPLGIKIANLWESIAPVDTNLWNNIVSWRNIVWSEDYQTSHTLQETNEPQIVIASSGMMNSGRSLSWAKLLLPHSNNHILFCGYSGKETIATRIKEGKSNQFLSLDGESIPNRCNITVLNSFSSHMCNSELLEYYSTIQYNKLCLVHSNYNDKTIFAKRLQEKLSKENRTSQVIIANKDMKLKI